MVIGVRNELARTEVTAAEVNWLVDQPTGPVRCQVKYRYRSPAVDATVEPFPGG